MHIYSKIRHQYLPLELSLNLFSHKLTELLAFKYPHHHPPDCDYLDAPESNQKIIH